jgi:hypothetical protein
VNLSYFRLLNRYSPNLYRYSFFNQAIFSLAGRTCSGLEYDFVSTGNDNHPARADLGNHLKSQGVFHPAYGPQKAGYVPVYQTGDKTSGESGGWKILPIPRTTSGPQRDWKP